MFLDVGQGDAILIRSPEGRTALIDAGPSPAIVEQLRWAGVRRLDVVIASHPHEDHIGAMAVVLQSFSFGRYLDNGTVPNTDLARTVATVVARTGIPRETAASQTIQLGSVTLRILPLPAVMESENDYSVGVLLEYGEFRALFTGDAETAEIHHFLEVGVPHVTLLKASHHGSRNGVTPQWVFATQPSLVVISAGLGNAYGHPDDWALRYYQRYAHDILRTDLQGTVTVMGRHDGSYRATTESGVQATGARPTPTPRGPAVPTTDDPVRIEVFANPPGNDNDRLNDEYVTIHNLRSEPLRIGGWSLCDAARHCFPFPADAAIPARGTITVHTGRGVPGNGHFYYGGRQAIWNNDGDTATLRDATGRPVGWVSY